MHKIEEIRVLSNRFESGHKEAAQISRFLPPPTEFLDALVTWTKLQLFLKLWTKGTILCAVNFSFVANFVATM